jgi:protein-L-isoaspartate(D-aspartate) O-methyltransferase
MTSLERLVAHLKNQGVLASERLEQAFLQVDRKDFVLPGDEYAAYQDHPLPIGWGQTISQPYTVAFMLELLDVKKGQSILDIGSGSGWTTALLSRLTGESGRVKGLERIPELVDFGKANLRKYPFSWASIRKAFPPLGDEGNSYDRILVSAGAPSFPEELTEQLQPEGILVIPVGSSLWKISRLPGRIQKEEYYGFSFVPLVF